mgnify:CR=1 FL=1
MLVSSLYIFYQCGSAKPVTVSCSAKVLTAALELYSLAAMCYKYLIMNTMKEFINFYLPQFSSFATLFNPTEHEDFRFATIN